ncbi:MAG: single-stranded DNA-binding protein [Oscillospiraceae bacterium]|nr:single-stranded DNA-binding protein [Oscillospiraceae bacterium]
MLNKVILMGRLTRDPELRHTQNNTPVASMRLAVDRGYRRDSAEPHQQSADFFDIVCWQQQAEFVSKWFRKGQLVAVAGRLQQRDWKDRDGNNRTSVEVVAQEVHFAEKKSDSQGQGAGAYPPPGASLDGPEPAGSIDSAPPAPLPPMVSSGFAELDDDDGELPF